MVMSYGFNIYGLLELLFYPFILLFLFIVIMGIINKNRNRILIIWSAVISIGLALLFLVLANGNGEGEVGFWILGLPLTLPLEAVGEIEAKYGHIFLISACTVLYAMNTFTILSSLLLIIKWIKNVCKKPKEH